MNQPMVPPMAMAAMISGRPVLCRYKVVPTAIAMPIMPLRLPAWLDSGDDRPRSERMKRTPAIR